MHLQKTGGTELVLRLREQFGSAEVYPDVTDGNLLTETPQLSPDRLRRRWAERGDEIRVITGHFPACTMELLDVPFTTLTVLRDPVERTLSLLRHYRERTPAATELTLEDVYAEPFRFRNVIENHMVKMFSLTLDEMDRGMFSEVEFTPERLERAQRRLETIDVVGLQEDFGGFCAELERRFGWRLGPPKHANRTEPVDVGLEFRTRIAADNAYDVELYHFARELVATRHRSPS